VFREPPDRQEQQETREPPVLRVSTVSRGIREIRE
jgi:hypothetical protein